MKEQTSKDDQNLKKLLIQMPEWAGQTFMGGY